MLVLTGFWTHPGGGAPAYVCMGLTSFSFVAWGLNCPLLHKETHTSKVQQRNFAAIAAGLFPCNAGSWVPLLLKEPQTWKTQQRNFASVSPGRFPAIRALSCPYYLKNRRPGKRNKEILHLFCLGGSQQYGPLVAPYYLETPKSEKCNKKGRPGAVAPGLPRGLSKKLYLNMLFPFLRSILCCHIRTQCQELYRCCRWRHNDSWCLEPTLLYRSIDS